MSGVVHAWTDGSCPSNPGHGAYAAILVYEKADGSKVHRPIAGGVKDSTNNRCEMLAVIHALKALTRPCDVVVHTDSKYVMDGFTKWMPRWRERGWRTADRKPVVNQDLWEELARQAMRHRSVGWQHVKGHRGIPLNERADKLAAAMVPMTSRQESVWRALDREFDWAWNAVRVS